MSDSVSVRRHTRRRTGRSAEIARRLGLPDTVTVAGFERRRPSISRAAIKKELKARVQAGLIDRKDFDYYYSLPSGDYEQGIDLLLIDLGVEPESKDPDTFIALRNYAELQVRLHEKRVK